MYLRADAIHVKIADGVNVTKVLAKGDVVYYAKISQKLDIYEIYELTIRTVADNYFVGIDKRTKHAYLFGYNAIDECVFTSRDEALELVRMKEKDRIETSTETYYEEY